MLLALQAEQALVCTICTWAVLPLTLKTSPVCRINSSINTKCAAKIVIFFYIRKGARTFFKNIRFLSKFCGFHFLFSNIFRNFAR